MTDLTIHRTALGYFIVDNRFSFATPNAASYKVVELLGVTPAVRDGVASFLARGFGLVDITVESDGTDISASKGANVFEFVSICN